MSKLKSVIKVSEPLTKAHTLQWKRANNNTTKPLLLGDQTIHEKSRLHVSVLY